MQQRAIGLLSVWIVALLGGCVGGAVSLTLEGLRRNAEAGGYGDQSYVDMWSWLLASLIALVLVAGTTAALPVRPERGAVAALVGAFIVAASPIEFRPGPNPQGFGLFGLLVSPAVIVIAVVVVNRPRA